MPHAPQLVALDFVSTQAPLHAVKPVPQLAAHAPLLHTGLAPAHPAPHAPQLLVSASVLTHVEPPGFGEGQSVAAPAGQTQVPALHVSDAPQGVAHPLQCFGSVIVSTQAPPQLVRAPLPPSEGAEQEVAQMPTLQTSPLGHACPHAPQLSGSVAGSVHVPLQGSWPGPVQTPKGAPSEEVPASLPTTALPSLPADASSPPVGASWTSAPSLREFAPESNGELLSEDGISVVASPRLAPSAPPSMSRPPTSAVLPPHPCARPIARTKGQRAKNGVCLCICDASCLGRGLPLGPTQSVSHRDLDRRRRSRAPLA
jgi:hypothetical protein